MKVTTKVVPHLKSGKCPGGAKEEKAGKRGKLCFLKLGRTSMGSKKPAGKK